MVSFRRGGDENLGRGNYLEAGRMVLADPGLLIAEPVQVLDQFQVAVNCFRRILVKRMKRGKEDTIAHWNRASHSSASFRLSIFDSVRISHLHQPPKPRHRLILGRLHSRGRLVVF